MMERITKSPGGTVEQAANGVMEALGIILFGRAPGHRKLLSLLTSWCLQGRLTGTEYVIDDGTILTIRTGIY